MGGALHLLPIYHSLPGHSGWLLSPTNVATSSASNQGHRGPLSFPAVPGETTWETDQNRGQGAIKCSPPCTSLTVPSPLGVQEGPAGPRSVGETDEFREETGSEEDREAFTEFNAAPRSETVRIWTWRFYSPEGGSRKAEAGFVHHERETRDPNRGPRSWDPPA